MTKSARTWIRRACVVVALALVAVLVALLAAGGWSAPVVPVVLLVGALVLVDQVAVSAYTAVDCNAIGHANYVLGMRAKREDLSRAFWLGIRASTDEIVDELARRPAERVAAAFRQVEREERERGEQ